MKRLRNLVCAFAVCLLALCALAVSARAEVSGDYTYRVESGGVVLEEYGGIEQYLKIPAEINEIPVVEIGESFIQDSKTKAALRSVFIPATVIKIGDGAFRDVNLTKVHYYGTKTQWKQINIGGDNGNLEDVLGHTWVGDACSVCGFSCQHDYGSTLRGAAVVIECANKCYYREEIPLTVMGGHYADGVYWFGSGQEATVVVPDGYTVEAGTGTYETSVKLSEDGDKDIWLRRDKTQFRSVRVSPLIRWDTTAPQGTISTTSDFRFGSVEQIQNPVCQGFTKTPVSMMFIADDYNPDRIDEGSGVRQIEYYVSDTAQVDPTSLKYVSYDDRPVSLYENGKYFIYARITDNVGNVTYINTPGLVIYEDSRFGDDVADCFYKMSWNWLVRFDANGNTINEVKVGNQKLEAGTDYEVDDSYLYIKPAFVGTLSVGEHELTISVNPQGERYWDNRNNEAPTTLSLPFKVKKMPLIKVAKPALKPDSVYNTQAQELLTKNETVEGTYEYAIGPNDTDAPADGWSADVPTATNAGTYHLWFRATPENTDNYEGTPGHYLGEVTIAKAVPTPFEFPVALDEITYGQKVKDIQLSITSNALGNFDWMTPDDVLDAGAWNPTVNFTPNALAMQNYDWTKYPDQGNGATWVEEDGVIRYQAAVTVNKAQMTYTLPVGEDLLFNNEQQELVNPGRCEQGDVLYSMREKGTYGKNIPAAREAGLYTVWYKFVPSAENANNYHEVAPQSTIISIDKSVPELKNVKAEIVKDTTDLSAVIVNYEVKDWQSGMLRLDDGQSLKLGENTLTYTFTPDDSSNLDAAYGSVKVTVVDTIPPTGEVTLSSSSWKEFLNTITFGKYYKENQTLKVTASDSFSGVAKVEYHESKTALDLAGVKALADSDWTAMEGTLSVTAENAKQFIYYVRITDKSGNVAYLSSDGAEFDTTAPVIEGVQNGVTYYTTQKVTVTDKNLDTVTLNGKSVTSPITLEGNKEATYTIVATDLAGNSTTVSIKMAPLTDISEAVADKTEETVTAADADKLEKILDTTAELLEDPDATAAEKAELEKAKETAEKLLAQVEEAAAALDTEEVESTLDTTGENVTLSQKEDIQKAIETIEKTMDTYGTNYTDADKLEIQQKLEELKSAQKAIANVESAAAAIAGLPETVEPDDVQTVNKIVAAAKAYAALTEHEKSLLEDSTVKKLTTLAAAAVDYKIIAGDKSTWSEGDLTITANGAYSKFNGISVDGALVDPQNYTAVSGSTIVTFKDSYLQKLSDGTHALTFHYTDGEVDGTFTVKGKSVNPSVPDTGDSAPTVKPSVPDTGDSAPTVKPSVPDTGDSAPTVKPSVPDTGDSAPTVKPSVPDTGDSAPAVNPSVPDTGDSANVLLWVGQMGISALGVTFLTICRRRKSAK